MRWVAVLALLSVFLAIPAFAHEVSLSWDPPLFLCGTNDPVTGLVGYTISWGDTQGGPYPNSYSISDPAIVTATIDVGSQYGNTLYFVIGSEPGGCGVSNEVSVPFAPAPPPSPPRSLTGAEASP